jgi:hypothetical protein
MFIISNKQNFQKYDEWFKKTSELKWKRNVRTVDYLNRESWIEIK